jgi:aminoglycoside 6'-N-acetyltransferase I
MQPRSARIRASRPTDAAALAVLGTELGCALTEAQVRRRRRLLDDPEREFIVGDPPDGFARFIDIPVQRFVETDPFGEIEGLVVTKPHRGRGLGRALLVAAAAWCRERDLEEMWIRANLFRVGAHEFYEAIDRRVVRDQRVYAYPL